MAAGKRRGRKHVGGAGHFLNRGRNAGEHSSSDGAVGVGVCCRGLPPERHTARLSERRTYGPGHAPAIRGRANDAFGVTAGEWGRGGDGPETRVSMSNSLCLHGCRQANVLMDYSGMMLGLQAQVAVRNWYSLDSSGSTDFFRTEIFPQTPMVQSADAWRRRAQQTAGNRTGFLPPSERSVGAG
jgi:hypothetical protein